ncbi:MAG: ribonuclease P protein component [Saccharofermentans sp.]|nr:ribonuclease P protein component [Saccharofermentans sp.]
MKSVALRFNFEFSRVYRYGKFATGKNLSVHVLRRREGTTQSGYKVNPVLRRTGFCANKKELGAVGRNRARRLMRESYRLYEDRLPTGYDYVFTLKAKNGVPDFSDLSTDMGKCLARLNLLEGSSYDA